MMTRARDALAKEGKAGSSRLTKKRKAGSAINGDLDLSSSALVKSRRRRVAVDLENSESLATSENSKAWREGSCLIGASNQSSDSSCCSNIESSQLGKENMELLDLQGESVEFSSPLYKCKHSEREEGTPSSEIQSESDEVESMSSPSVPNSRLKEMKIEKIMSSEAEIEQFFAVAEKDLQKRFKEKYNYDIVKDVPLEGRYNWIQQKP